MALSKIAREMLDYIESRREEVRRAEAMSPEALDAELKTLIESDLDELLFALGMPQPEG
jgi:hypothetical protein